MSQPYGSNQIASIGAGMRSLSNPETARWKAGGVTFDWDTVTAVSGSDVTLVDGTVIKIGDKYIRYGTIVTRITDSGKFGPADTGANDGRQIVTNAVRGDAFILDRTVILSELGRSEIVGDCYDAGIAYRDRLNLGYSGAPTEANLETMLPGVTFAKD
jgi:hypothetical protein